MASLPLLQNGGISRSITQEKDIVCIIVLWDFYSSTNTQLNQPAAQLAWLPTLFASSFCEIFKLRLGASIASLVGLSVGRSVGLQRKIDNEITTPVFNTK